MEHLRRSSVPALSCALAVLFCWLISRPFAEMGVCDDWSYVFTAQKLAATGHIMYNAWGAPILGWQLYLAAAFIKLFGASFTVVRLSTVVVAMATAFFIQRILVRLNLSERDATIGTLAMVLSPLFLMLSATFMSDIQGLFALVICLYGCVRALQALTDRDRIGWICFAVVTNAICGSSRQIAWLGLLVMVPSTLWLLRGRRRLVLAGAFAVGLGAVFIYGCVRWFNRQPYTIPEHLHFYLTIRMLEEFVHVFLDLPFLLLPLTVLFFPGFRKTGRRFAVVVVVLSAGYSLLAMHYPRVAPSYLLSLHGDWVGKHGTYEAPWLRGQMPLFLHSRVLLLPAIASTGGLLGLLACILQRRTHSSVPQPPGEVSWFQLGVLLGPFTLAYVCLLIPRSAEVLFDRYMLIPMLVALLVMLRLYRDQVQPRLPETALVLTAFTAGLGIVLTHNMFSFYRARVTLAAELRAAGVPDTSVDNGWEYNLLVQVKRSGHINDQKILVPRNAYVPVSKPPDSICPLMWFDRIPAIHPLYGVSFEPKACLGPAPFAPVTYSRWFARPGTLYVVRYTRPNS